MKLLKLLFGRKPARPARQKAPTKPKKNLLLVLLDKILQIPLAALEAKWNEDLWKPKF
ncbi:MAG: hypothetical protein IJV40_16470 [Oscillospiraceae bacterium]|nr:hypothetical protein [Oscillospiraceae bacterium]